VDLLQDRVAVVTGGASGIGAASALLFAANGAKVVVADIDELRAGEIVTRMQAAGGEAMFVKTDVSSAQSAEAMARAALDRWGRIDILMNNAAATVLCNEKDRPVHELEEWVWDKMMAVTLKSVFLCSKYVLPVMMKQNRGVIINISSVNALISEPGFDSYTAAKGAVISLTRSMATEYAQYGIRVNAICPGYIITECQRGWYEGDEAARAQAEAKHLTRLGRPEDIANMAVYLASDRAEFLTGALIPVDGGFTALKGSASFVRTGSDG
jgi:NAD(P)-dependent dehydrogenase (short-subunit alcohol dehydrogenase family)